MVRDFHPQDSISIINGQFVAIPQAVETGANVGFEELMGEVFGQPQVFDGLQYPDIRVVQAPQLRSVTTTLSCLGGCTTCDTEEDETSPIY